MLTRPALILSFTPAPIPLLPQPPGVGNSRHRSRRSDVVRRHDLVHTQGGRRQPPHAVCRGPRRRRALGATSDLRASRRRRRWGRYARPSGGRPGKSPDAPLTNQPRRDRALAAYRTTAHAHAPRPRKGIWAAVKADTLSIIAFQVGLFLGMWLYQEILFSPGLPKTTAAYWMMMQLSMILGFFTAWPVNAWLVRVGWKERM
ncbi:DUF4396 domain-containing protein [Streptomyces coelicoflavus]|uniref:DUF4396 domain-containing protein n=1 Tax=Streptomyces coelicoflavus TaxID=285562 RepID=UPI003A8978AF